MKEDVEMTELALGFPLFDEQNLSSGRRHQVYLIPFLILISLDIFPSYSKIIVFKESVYHELT